MRRARGLACAALLCLAGLLGAQTPDAPDVPPVPIPTPRPAPSLPNPGLPSPGLPSPGIPDALPPDDQNSQNPPTASASFEPPVGRLGRPLEYRVIILAGQRVPALPERPRVNGMTFYPLTAAPSTQAVQLSGTTMFKTTFRFRVEVEEVGAYTAPTFQLKVGSHDVQVPATHINVQEAVTQGLRALLDLPKRDYFVGETISARLICLDTPDEQALSLQHVAKTSGAVLLKTGQRTMGRQNFTWEGKPATGIILPVEITPLIAGENEVNCQVQVFVNRKGNYARDTFVQSGGIATLDSSSVRLNVLSIPQAGRPPGFTGAIGKFTVKPPQLSAKEVEVGEPVGILLELRGNGNIDSVPPPDFPAQPDWIAYRPTSSFEADDDGGGTKSYAFTLVAKRAGLNSTPALPFAYFDPEAREFHDISIPPLPISVKPGSNPVPGEAAKSDAAPMIDAPSEVPPALTGLAERPGRWLNSPAPPLRAFLFAQIVPPCLLLALWAWRRRSEYLAHNPGVIRRKRAHAAARAALGEARAAARRNDFPAFLSAGLGALREAAAPLDSAQAGSLTREEVLRQLRDDQRASRAAESFFQSAEASRYAHEVATSANPASMLPELEHAVARLSARA